MTTMTSEATSATMACPRGWTACATCGQPVQEASGAPTVTLRAVAHLPANRTPTPAWAARQPGVTINLARCPACGEREALAKRLAEQHPRVVRPIGSPSVAADRIAAALGALAATDHPVPDIAPGPTGDTALATLIAFLTRRGAGATWAAGLVPYWGDEVAPERAATAPWSHVTDDQRAAIRQGTSNWLAARSGHATPAPPPTGGGCLWCGRAAEQVRPGGDAADAWGVEHTWEARHLGARGRRGMEKVTGHLCRACRVVYDETRAVGPTALERAFLAHLRPTRGFPETPELNGLTAWAISGREPGEPWAHARLSPQSAALLGVE